MAARVLVVEDDEPSRVALGRALRLEGYEVGFAVGGAEAGRESRLIQTVRDVGFVLRADS